MRKAMYINMNPCENCVYYRRISSANPQSDLACHYLVDTGRVRPCPTENCTCKRVACARADYIKLISTEFGGRALLSMMEHYGAKSLRNLSDAQAKDYYALLGGRQVFTAPKPPKSRD